jgi:hypothetical protein
MAWLLISLTMGAALLVFVIWTSHDEVFVFRGDRTCEVTRWFVWPPEPYIVTLEAVEGASFKVRSIHVHRANFRCQGMARKRSLTVATTLS